ncbi:sensor histidine kinase [Undibacterium aquatile]|uniref:histidine kinase n=1 Tax=Undibacterium aquatile TaxID=1537398 RepID=A0ABR6XFN3_9BURK|nr:ATP-binding protein [Undibacterium aquatile]MBC3811575.1 sensor histidine kinase [Undibacterium aquatile]
MNSHQRIITMCLSAACSVALIFFAYLFFAQKEKSEIRLAGDRQLQIIALDLESVLERYETLPYSISYLPLAAQVLANPADKALVQQLNLTLQDMQQQAKVAAIYLMDAQGLTIASSNWNSAQSYIEKNFSFRPYFQDAMVKGGGAGHFYGVGNTTSIPGYFISQPVHASAAQRSHSAPVGVITVKISLDEFQKSWRSNNEPIALTDRNGVVFLSNRDEWRYRSLRLLDKDVLNDIQATLQYSGKPVTAISSLPKKDQAGFGDYLTRPIGRLGWQLMLFPDESKVVQAGVQAAVISMLLLVLAATVAGVYYQRRRRIEERQAAAIALQRAADELELKIAQRTGDLILANMQLEEQFNKLQTTEQVLRSTQNEMVQTGKLAMLGQMAAGITHELNQPLTAIRAFADNAGTFLQRGKTDEAIANLQHISDASARMGSIIAQLKGFARKSSGQLGAVDVCSAVHASIAMLQSDIERLKVEVQLAMPDKVLVLGDSVRIEQVLINLLRNALDAVETSAVRKIEVLLELSDAHVSLQIRDSGAGLPEDVITHLFEPFFTTKPSGKGLGLGLAISSSIVQAMNGSLHAGNHIQGGAQFVIRLPVLPE